MPRGLARLVKDLNCISTEEGVCEGFIVETDLQVVWRRFG